MEHVQTIYEYDSLDSKMYLNITSIDPYDGEITTNDLQWVLYPIIVKVSCFHKQNSAQISETLLSTLIPMKLEILTYLFSLPILNLKWCQGKTNKVLVFLGKVQFVTMMIGT